MNETSKVYLNSRDADIVSNGEHKFFLASHISLPSSEHRFSVGLADMCIPLTYYNVFEANNFLIFNISGVDYSVSIEAGNYDIGGLLDFVNAALDPAAGLYLEYVAKRMKVSVSSSAGVCTVGPGTANGLLGLAAGHLIPGGQTVLAPSCINLQRTQNIFVRSSLQTRNFSAQSRHDTLAKIPVTCGMGEVMVFQSRGGMNQSGVPHVTVLAVSLVDDDGRELDLNGLPFSMTIELTAIRNNGVQEYLPHGDRAQI